jgi:hypothetical protein
MPSRHCFLAKEQHRRNAGCGKAKHDKIDHPVLLQILTGQAGKSSETMQPERAAGHRPNTQSHMDCGA